MKASELVRKFGSKKQKSVSELKQVISTRSDQNPNFCLFLGAGASRSSGIRTAGEMVDEWRSFTFKELNPDSKSRDYSNYEMSEWLLSNCSDWYDKNREYSSLIEKIYPLQTNRRKFIETEVSEKIPSIGYAYLVRIAESGLLRTIFTTNFDDLLNEAFYQFSSERALVCAHDSNVNTISITSRRTKIVKLHGDYLFDDLKNTASETHSLDSNMKSKLTEFLKEYGLIIGGYSGSDKSITSILENLSGGDSYLQNGLFWCFREEDEVTQEALDILSRPRSFFVITQGFDELMADLYTMLDTNSTPFNSKLASDRAANIIETYLQNVNLKNSSSKIIKKHLEALESDKNASLMSDMMKDLNADRIASAGLSDQNLLVYLEIERALKERNPEDALVRLGQELAKTESKRFKEILLHRRFVCSSRLNKMSDAKDTVKEMLNLEPANFYVALSESSLLETRYARIDYLDRLRIAQPFSAQVLNQFSEELREALDNNDKVPSGLKTDDVINALNRSLEIDTSLSNPAWSYLFSMNLKDGKSAKCKNVLTEIVEKHLLRDAYSSETSSMLFRYCKKFGSITFKDRQLFEYLLEAYTKHFPREYPEHLKIIVKACIEFDGHRILRPILEEARINEELIDDPRFTTIMMEVYYDVFRDLPGAIAYGRNFMKSHEKTSVELKLVNYLLDNSEIKEARELHTKLKGAIELSQWMRLEAKIFEYEERYQDAIDTIESIPDKREFDERFTSILSYLDLKMASPARAVKRSKEFLQMRSFPLCFESEIINYEYGKKLDGRRIDLKRITAIFESTQSEDVKAVCLSLQDKDDEALTILQRESEKRFSKIHEFLRWPAISKLQPQLRKIREELIKGKRSLSDLPI